MCIRRLVTTCSRSTRSELQSEEHMHEAVAPSLVPFWIKTLSIWERDSFKSCSTQRCDIFRPPTHTGGGDGVPDDLSARHFFHPTP